jgi:hypothetical protein
MEARGEEEGHSAPIQGVVRTYLLLQVPGVKSPKRRTLNTIPESVDGSSVASFIQVLAAKKLCPHAGA